MCLDLEEIVETPEEKQARLEKEEAEEKEWEEEQALKKRKRQEAFEEWDKKDTRKFMRKTCWWLLYLVFQLWYFWITFLV